MGIDPAQLLHNQVKRNDRYLPRHHHRRQKQNKDKFVAGKAEFGKGIRGHRRGKQRGSNHDKANIEAIEVGAAEGQGLERRRIIRPHDRIRYPLRRNNKGLGNVLERRQDHPQEWKNHHERADGQKYMQENGLPSARARLDTTSTNTNCRIGYGKACHTPSPNLRSEPSASGHRAERWSPAG